MSHRKSRLSLGSGRAVRLTSACSQTEAPATVEVYYLEICPHNAHLSPDAASDDPYVSMVL